MSEIIVYISPWRLSFSDNSKYRNGSQYFALLITDSLLLRTVFGKCFLNGLSYFMLTVTGQPLIRGVVLFLSIQYPLSTLKV